MPSKPDATSQLDRLLEDRLGRRLSSDEAQYVLIVRNFYRDAKKLAEIPAHFFPYLLEVRFKEWTPVKLWKDPPKTEYAFWQYLAFFLEERKSRIPEFMTPLIDREWLRENAGEWFKEKEARRWRVEFASVINAEPARHASSNLEFQLALGPEEALVQYRQKKREAFRVCLPPMLKEINSSSIDPIAFNDTESLTLWSLLNSLSSLSAPSLPFTKPECRLLIGKILNAPGLEEKIVDENGQPLRVNSEPLTWNLLEPVNGAYTFQLRHPGGANVKELLAVFPASTNVFFTECGVFRGPDFTGFGPAPKPRYEVPASALETVTGVELLAKLRLPTPAALEKRIDVHRAIPRLSVTFHRRSGHAQEYCECQLTASCGELDWSVIWSPENWIQRKSPPDDQLYRVDRSALKKAAEFFERLTDFPGSAWQRYDNVFRIRVSKRFPDFFSEWLASLPEDVDLALDPVIQTLSDPPIRAKVDVQCDEVEIDWFDLRVDVDYGGLELTREEIEALQAAQGNYVRLGEKGWRRLVYDFSEKDEAALAKLGMSPTDFDGTPQRVHSLHLADPAVTHFLPPKQVESIRERIANLKASVAPPVPDDITGDLRPYQLEGFHFLAYLSENRFGGILADDMGLGKTLQTLAWLRWLKNKGESKQPALVVAPKSVTGNWRAEAAKFAPSIRVQVGDKQALESLRKTIKQIDLLVINYAQLRLWADDLAKVPWLAVILDEAQAIKNPTSQAAEAARALQTQHRLALSGTPIENRAMDLWSLMTFAFPGILGSRAEFAKRFDNKKDPLARARLASRVRPFLLRRTKLQVAKDLPDRIEEDIVCELEERQQILYQAELKRARQLLLNVQSQKELHQHQFTFLASLLRLRQICCHPGLISEAEQDAPSAKVDALLDLLEPILDEGQKVLVFSQFTTMLKRLRASIEERQWNSFYLDGATENRDDLINQFQTSPDSAVFLISIKAGGFGLNLTAAPYVVIFDPWWNPAVENQAIDRAHRIGQTQTVIAYRLLAQNTIEEKIRQLQKQKAGLVEEILGEERFAKSLTLDDLKYLLAD